MKHEMLESRNITIKGVEHKFLKPYAYELMDIEDAAKYNSQDSLYYEKAMLRLVNVKLDVEDLVKYVASPMTMSDGSVLTMAKITLSQYMDTLAKLRKTKQITRTAIAKEALVLAGVSGDISLNEFKYEDLDVLADEFSGMYDTAELDEVVDTISTFCIS